MRSILALVFLTGALAVLALATPQDASARGGREHLNLPGSTSELPFSHAVRVGNTLYVAGTLGLDDSGAPPQDPKEEARLVLDGIRAKLALADMSMDDLVSVQVFCPDLSLYGAFNEVYRTYFGEGFPARAFIGSGPLLRGCRFEVNGIAAR